jgi:hypothetical protein
VLRRGCSGAGAVTTSRGWWALQWRRQVLQCGVLYCAVLRCEVSRCGVLQCAMLWCALLQWLCRGAECCGVGGAGLIDRWAWCCGEWTVRRVDLSGCDRWCTGLTTCIVRFCLGVGLRGVALRDIASSWGSGGCCFFSANFWCLTCINVTLCGFFR